MIDLIDNHIMFTLNGEMLISDSGSELAFKEIEIGDGKQSASFLQRLNSLCCPFPVYTMAHIKMTFQCTALKITVIL